VHKECGVACVDGVSHEVIKKWYTKIDSHGCIEAHLPGYVPVELIERIVLPASMLKGNLLEVLKGWETSEGPLFDRVVSFDLPFAQYRSSGIYIRPATSTGSMNVALRRLCTVTTVNGIRVHPRHHHGDSGILAAAEVVITGDG